MKIQVHLCALRVRVSSHECMEYKNKPFHFIPDYMHHQKMHYQKRVLVRAMSPLLYLS